MDTPPYETEAVLAHLMAAQAEAEAALKQVSTTPTIDGLEANAIEISVGTIRKQLDAIVQVLDSRH